MGKFCVVADIVENTTALGVAHAMAEGDGEAIERIVVEAPHETEMTQAGRAEGDGHRPSRGNAFAEADILDDEVEPGPALYRRQVLRHPDRQHMGMSQCAERSKEDGLYLA